MAWTCDLESLSPKTTGSIPTDTQQCLLPPGGYHHKCFGQEVHRAKMKE